MQKREVEYNAWLPSRGQGWSPIPGPISGGQESNAL